jgi:Resolvase, N terminal domain
LQSAFDNIHNVHIAQKRMAKGKYVSYLRVSTDKQGRSGLGLEAQREAVTRYLNGGKWTLAAEYVETESGKRNDRPKLTAALTSPCQHQGSLPANTE